MIPTPAMLPDKDPAESVVVEFAFDGELVAIDTAAVTIALLNGADPGMAAMLVGPAQIQGTSVLQRVSAGVDLVNYKLRCTATHGVNVRVQAAVLPVRTA